MNIWGKTFENQERPTICFDGREADRNFVFRQRQREGKLIREIQHALRRLDEGLVLLWLKRRRLSSKGHERLYFNGFIICNDYGYTVANEAPDKCLVCGAIKKAFYMVLSK